MEARTRGRGEDSSSWVGVAVNCCSVVNAMNSFVPDLSDQCALVTVRYVDLGLRSKFQD